MNSWIWFVSIFFQCSFSHTDTTFWHEVQLEEFIVLNTKDHFVFFVDVTSINISDRCWTVVVWETSSFIVSFCFFYDFFNMKRTFSWSSKETFITIIWCVVSLNEARNACFLFPIFSFEAFPGFVKNILCFNDCFNNHLFFLYCLSSNCICCIYTSSIPHSNRFHKEKLRNKRDSFIKQFLKYTKSVLYF